MKTLDSENRDVGAQPRDELGALSRSKAQACAPTTIPSRSRLWLWVVAACVFQAAVWAAWITLASKHPVQEVPVATAAR